MVERTLIVIIALLFFASSWWWSHRQNNTVDFYEVQLRDRDNVISQLCLLALPQVRDKSPEQVRALFAELYPGQDVREEDGDVLAGLLGVRFAEGGAAELYLPWNDKKNSSPQ